MDMESIKNEPTAIDSNKEPSDLIITHRTINLEEMLDWIDKQNAAAEIASEMVEKIVASVNDWKKEGGNYEAINAVLVNANLYADKIFSLLSIQGDYGIKIRNDMSDFISNKYKSGKGSEIKTEV
jgi:hypothetical protein